MEKNGRHLTREKVKYANASFCVFVYRKMTRTGLPHSVKSCHSLTFIHKQKKKSFRALGVLEAPYVCRNPIRDDFVLILENSFSEPSELGLEVGSQESLIRKYYYVLHTKKPFDEDFTEHDIVLLSNSSLLHNYNSLFCLLSHNANEPPENREREKSLLQLQ